MRRILAALAGAALIVTVAGCQSGPVVVPQNWTEVDLPSGLAASALLAVDGRLVVAGPLPGGPDGDGQPALFATDDVGSLAPLPIQPVSFYGARTLWTSLVADGSRILALGGKTGGGHGNPRWTTWAGDLDGLTEDPAPGIEVFGGWGAGGLAGIVVADGQPVIVGGHSSANGGLDIAVWLQQGTDWVRQPSDGTGLAATADVFPFPTAVAVHGSELVIAGYAQHLGGGKVQDLPAVWVGAIGGPWRRIDLPTTGVNGSAQAVACDERSCTVTGEVGGSFAAWAYSEGDVDAYPPLDIPVADDQVLPQVRWGDDWFFVLPNGAATELVGFGGEAALWTTYVGPTGTPVAAVAVGPTLYVLTSDGAGPPRLWSAIR